MLAPATDSDQSSRSQPLQVDRIQDLDLGTVFLENTARFTKIIEEYVRANPDQWLWVHKRWKTRPPGEKGIYPA